MSFEVNVDTLMYSPWVVVYAAHVTAPGEYTYYDLSEDITDCSVTRNVGDCSTCSFTLLNNNGKYNNLFEPMDLVTIYAKKEGHTTRLFTGYITDVPKFNLVSAQLSFRGKCSLYRIQKYYWDPGLQSSQISALLKGGIDNGKTYELMLFNLLTKVGGIPAEDISIGDMPQEVIEWATGLYEANMSQRAQTSQQLNEFYEMLKTTGLKGGYGGADTDVGTSGSSSSARVQQYMQAAEEIADIPNLSYGDSRVRGYWDSSGFHDRVNGDPWQIDKKPIGYIACNSFVWYRLDRGGFHDKKALKSAYKSFATGNFSDTGETKTLKKLGFEEHDYKGNESELQYGDVMWKNGHTGFYYKKGYVLSAHVSRKSIEKCVGPEKLKKNGYWKKYYRLPQESETASAGSVPINVSGLEDCTTIKKIADLPKKVREVVQAASNKRQKVINKALSMTGVYYKWGGESPTGGFDCSGLCMLAYKAVGISLPHQSESQKSAAKETYAVSKARVGDILWRNGHVELFLAPGWTVGTNQTGKPCRIRKLDASRYSCACRLLP